MPSNTMLARTQEHKAAGFYSNHHPVANDYFNNTGYGNHPNLRLAANSTLIDKGTNVGLPYNGSALDLDA